MRIDWLLPAIDAELTGVGTMTITDGGVDTLVVPELAEASSLQIVLAMRVVGAAQEWQTDHSVAVELTTDTGEREVLLQERLGIPEATLLEPDREIGVLFPARCRWNCERAGEFGLAVLLDGRFEARVTISVVEAA